MKNIAYLSLLNSVKTAETKIFEFETPTTYALAVRNR